MVDSAKSVVSRWLQSIGSSSLILDLVLAQQYICQSDIQ